MIAESDVHGSFVRNAGYSVDGAGDAAGAAEGEVEGEGTVCAIATAGTRVSARVAIRGRIT
jgi:hypothetical protein